MTPPYPPSYRQSIDYLKSVLLYHFFSTSDHAGIDFGIAVDKNMDKHRFVYMAYVASSFVFALGGISVLYKLDALTEQWSSFWPWKYEAYWLIFQTFSSYMSDVHTLGYQSYWHCFDRCYATFVFFSMSLRGILITFQLGTTTTTTSSDENNNFEPYFQPLPDKGHFIWMYCICLILSTICFVTSYQYTTPSKPEIIITAKIHKVSHFKRR